jgi:hypothetical protein
VAVSFVCVHAQEFSADLVNTRPGENTEHSAKIYVGKNKIRMESGQERENRGAFIIDGNTNSTIILVPERKMYIESLPDQAPGAQGFKNIQAFMRPADPNNACPQWEAAMASMKDSENKITSCRKLGTDVVNGRTAVKYQGTNSKGETGYVWVDPKLRFFLKWEGKDGGAELRNIKEGSQAASLFEVPSDYTKFDMGSMMRNRRGGRKPQ